MGPLKRAVVTAAGATDIAALAMSAAAVAALGFPSGRLHFVSAAVIISAGICGLCFLRLVPDVVASAAIFLMGCVLAATLANAGHGGLPWLALAGLTVSLAGPWPIGVCVFAVELGAINSSYGSGGLLLCLIVTALATVFCEMLEAARAAGILLSVGVAVVLVWVLAVTSGSNAQMLWIAA